MGGGISSAGSALEAGRMTSHCRSSENALVNVKFLTGGGDCSLGDHFRVDQNLLGRGAFGFVKKCARISDGTEFAVKFISKKGLLEKCRGSSSGGSAHDEVALLNTEIEALHKCVGHHGVLHLIGCFETVQSVQLVMELARGGELFDRIIASKHFSEHDACGIFKQVVDALAFLHNKGIVHRDLKPENLLLADAEGLSIKVCDFGLAKILAPKPAIRTFFGGSEARLLMHTACGSRLYAAPEVVAHQAYDASVDFWSTGVVLFLMLTGEQPFDTLEAVRKGDYAEKRAKPQWSLLSKECQALIGQLLQVDPEKRPSAEELLGHAWCVADHSEQLALPSALELLRGFRVQTKLRKMFLQIMLHEMKSSEIDQLKARFAELDTDGNGYVSRGELRRATEHGHVAMDQGGGGEAATASLGEDDAECISYEDYLASVLARNKSALQSHLHEVFATLDTNHDGVVSVRELHDGIKQLLGHDIALPDLKTLVLKEFEGGCNAAAGEPGTSPRSRSGGLDYSHFIDALTDIVPNSQWGVDTKGLYEVSGDVPIPSAEVALSMPSPRDPPNVSTSMPSPRSAPSAAAAAAGTAAHR